MAVLVGPRAAGRRRGSFEAADGSVFVKDGFCWPAFSSRPLWLLFRRHVAGLPRLAGGRRR